MNISIASEPIFFIGSFGVTNTLITAWLAILVIIVLASIFSKGIKKVPGRFQALGEIVLEGFMDFMETFAGSRAKVRQFLPLVGTIFVFVLAANWIGTLPGVETIGFHSEHEGHEVFIPLFRTVNSDLNMTLALALIVVIGTHIVGLKTIGKHHVGKFIVNPFKNPIGFFVGGLELIGEVSRVVSLTFRLFGNIFAGSVLMMIISFLAPYIVPIPFLGLEIFVGFIQALVFSVLAMMFMSAAVEMHAEEH
jgi:F-type H+-transporting ATPase subunit a